MEESKKKLVMIGVIVVCLALAGLITYMRYSKSSGGIADIPSEEMVWVKCSNKACNAEYQMGKRDYYKVMQEHINPLSSAAPPLVCKKCGQESIYLAEKCGNPQCGIVFFCRFCSR